MTHETHLFVLSALPAMAIPALVSLTAVLAPHRAVLASGGALTLAALSALVAFFQTDAAGPPLGVQRDSVTHVMLLLVSALGGVVLRYARTYLDGDAGLTRHVRWLLLTLGAVSTLVITSNLAVLTLAWTATSLALHQLLTFYHDRPAAQLAAHKKFFISRLADLSLWPAVGLVYRNVGSLNFDAIATWIGAHPDLPTSMHVAAALVAVAVILRSAQLPFHGWLIQVMEAPTPVSALLHAGVVNIGGFVLIRLAPLISQAPLAQGMLVCVGLLTAIAAALIMTTRGSIKVALAWSTCAQMGFMLVQCGLGLWHLALLHVLAHSLYKAHAFLSAGSAVDTWKQQVFADVPTPPSLHRVAVTTLALVAGAWGSMALLGDSETHDLTRVLALLLSLSLLPFFVSKNNHALGGVVALVRGGGVVLLYVGWHALADALLPVRFAAPPWWTSWVVVLGMAVLFVIKSTLLHWPNGRMAQALHPYLFSGFYVDEGFTRLTLRLWPARLARPRQATKAFVFPPTMETQP